MNSKIPEISFNTEKKQVNTVGFEFINLNKLMQEGNFVSPKDHNPYVLHRVQFHSLVLLTEGNIQHKVDFETCTAKSGDSIFISNGQIHAFDKKQYNGFLILFTDSFVAKHFPTSCLKHLNILLNNFTGIKKFHSPSLNQELINKIQEDIETTPTTILNEILALHLLSYLLKISQQQQVSTSENHKQQELFNRFKTLIKQEIGNTRNAKRYAEKLFVSYKTLNKACKKVAHKTPKTMIDDYIVLEAKRYLVSTQNSIKEISYTLGFNDPTNFQKFFKKHVRLTPNEFKKKH